MDSTIQIARAFDFAARKHTRQRRKGSGGEPYVNHPAEVALLVAEATGGADPALIVASILHDTIEDTETTPQEIEALFGKDVARLVLEVTDDKRLPKEERKLRQVEHAASTSVRARLLKIADKTSNLRSLASSPPLGWSLERRRSYVAWSRSVVERCRGSSPALESAYDAACAEAEASIDRASRGEGP